MAFLIQCNIIAHCALFQAAYCPRREFRLPLQWTSMTHLKQDVVSLAACYSEPTDTIRSCIYIISYIKNTQQCLPYWSHRTWKNAEVKTRQDPLVESVTGQSGGKWTGDCVLFSASTSQTEPLTKCPLWATSFHSDWPNWDLLTANPIRAGTGQSEATICHLHSTGLPRKDKCSFCLHDPNDLPILWTF